MIGNMLKLAQKTPIDTKITFSAFHKLKAFFTSSSSPSDSSPPKLELIYGLNPTMIALNANRRKNIQEILISQSVQGRLPPRVANIINTANSKKIPVRYIMRDKLDKIVRGQPHQNVVLKAERLKYIRTNSADILSGNMILYIEGYLDQHTFGAVVRTAYYLGVENIVVEEAARCSLDALASKTSAGALELANLYCTKSPIEFLQDCRQRGWKVYSYSTNDSVIDPKADQNSSKITALHKLKVSCEDKIVLAIRNDGHTSEAIEKTKNKQIKIDETLYLPASDKQRAFPYSLLDPISLNSAVGLLVQDIRKKMSDI